MQKPDTDVAVVGAGIVGIACAYYLKQRAPSLHVTLIDEGEPMALTSAKSGENYRNWWPHPAMTAFTDRSIDLLERIASDTQNRINMTRRGYILATRSEDTQLLMDELVQGYGDANAGNIRVHDGGASNTYQPPFRADWADAPNGVDVLACAAVVREHFPSYASDISTLVHVRRAGAISGQQLGQYMLEALRGDGFKRVRGRVSRVDRNQTFCLTFDTVEPVLAATRIVNAAGPFAANFADLLDYQLPVTTVFQQKIAFRDTHAAIPRDLPFSIDLDPQLIDWTPQERDMLAESPEFVKFSRPMPGAIHCRPDGGDDGNWIKLGWAYNETPTTPDREPQLDDQFPQIVIRGAARLNPSLRAYYDHVPRERIHYGGYYTMTQENWPLLGPGEYDFEYVACALSGYGTMGACAAGDLIADWILEADLPSYARSFAPGRYLDETVMADIRSQTSRGVL